MQLISELVGVIASVAAIISFGLAAIYYYYKIRRMRRKPPGS